PSDDAPRAALPTDLGFMDAPQVREGQRSEGQRRDRGTPLPALWEIQRARVLALPHAGLGARGASPEPLTAVHTSVQIVFTTSSNTVGARSIRPAPCADHESSPSAPTRA